MTQQLFASSVPSPSSDKFTLESYPPTPPYDIHPSTPTTSFYPSGGYLMVFTKLPAFLCAWFNCLCLCALRDRTGTALSSFLFLLFGGDVFGESNLAQLTLWGGSIYSAWRRDNDLSRPIIGKYLSITFNHVHNFSEAIS